MEHTELVARVLRDVAAARAAVASNYARLWRPEPAAASPEPNTPDLPAEPEPDADTDAARDQHRPRDVDR
jgi:hypothetical protein